MPHDLSYAITMLSYDSHIFSSQAIKRATHTHVIFPSEQARYSHTCACNLTYNKQALYSHTCACNLTHKLPRPRSRRRLSLVRASLLKFIEQKNASKRSPCTLDGAQSQYWTYVLRSRITGAGGSARNKSSIFINICTWQG